MDARRDIRTLLMAAILSLTAACSGGADNGKDTGSPTDTGTSADTAQSPDTGTTSGDADGTEGDAAAVKVTSVQPASGSVDGGTTVAVSGTGFASGATVDFGGTEAPSASFVSEFKIEATTPASDTAGDVDVRVELPNGNSSTLTDGFEYTGDPGSDVEIGWCNLQHPPSITVGKGEETPTVYGRVLGENCTADEADERVECEGITGQVGWGPTDVDPSASPGEYQWTDATYNDQFPPTDKTNNNDEHQATFTPSSTGQFSYVYRFSGDGRDSWTYCDLDGSPFSTDQLGSLTVE